MKNLIETMEKDKELDRYLSLSTKEKMKFLDDILLYANNNRNAIIDFCHRTEPAQFCNLDLVYEALAEDAANWGEFIYEEFRRIIEAAKKVDDPFTYTECLDIGLYFEDKSAPYVQKIIDLLVKELDSPLDALRHRAVWFLSDWIEDQSDLRHAEVVKKMAERIHDKNWKIRYLTHLVLKDKPLPSGNTLKLSFWDTFRGKFSILFSSPFDIP